MLVSQTARECTYKDTSFCTHPMIGTRQRVTPLDAWAEHELRVSQHIKTIPDYARRYAPVTAACPLNVALVGEATIKKCLAYDASARFAVFYEKDADPLVDYLQANPSEASRMERILLESVDALYASGVVHGAITAEALVVTRDTRVPLIRDFRAARLNKKSQVGRPQIPGNPHQALAAEAVRMSADPEWRSTAVTKGALERALAAYAASVPTKERAAAVQANTEALASYADAQTWGAVYDAALVTASTWDADALRAFFKRL